MTDTSNTTEPTVEARESGAALPIVAMMLIVLLGLSAFAVDLGWFYVHATRVQRAADAAALAGVIHMPYDFDQAEVDAVALAGVNGYVIDGGTNVEVTPVVDQPNQIQVEVQDTVPTFFLKVFGQETQTISRSARAEFVPPLPLGSPENQFGNTCDPAQAGCTGQPNFWANIHGKYTQRSMGDAYSANCVSGSGTGCGTTNPVWRERGYLYGVEASAPGAAFTVSFVDMAFHNTSGGQTTGDNHRTGDRGCEAGAWGNSTNAACGQTIVTTLFGPDGDPLDISNNPVICTHTWTPQPQVAANAAYPTVSPACMTVNSPSAGIYVLQVKAAEPTQVAWSGLNRYGLRVSPGARMYGLGDMSIYNNFTGSVTAFYLAEVDPGYRGKTFVVEMFDPGEGNGHVQLMGPSGANNWSIFSSCRMYTRATGVMTGGWTDQGTRAPCQFQANNADASLNYNDRWVKLEVTMPTNYDCQAAGNNCWWKINYNYTGGVNDTTTWRAYIVGNPIHLVPSA
jgi:hypothetical protein